MTADVLPVLSSVRKRIPPDIELFRFRVLAQSNRGTIPYFIDFHFCGGMVAVPRMCPCKTIIDELCYRTPLSRQGIQVDILSLLATAMSLYENTFEALGETALIISGNYNIGESEEKPSRKAKLYLRSFQHSKYRSLYSCIRLDRNSFLLLRNESGLLWSEISAIFKNYCDRVKELESAIRSDTSLY